MTSYTPNTPWFSNLEVPDFPALHQNIETDVCIIGAGLSGMTTAYNLCREGKKVIVIDQNGLGKGETGHTTAHLSNALDDRYSEIIKLFGEEGSKIAAESHTEAINFIEKTVKKEKVDCDFTRLDGYLFLPLGQEEKILDEELEAAQKSGLTEVHKTDKAPLENFNTGPCLVFPNQGQFHPLKYLLGLLKVLQQQGAEIFFQTQAIECKENKDHVEIKTKEGYMIKAKHAVVATNSPFLDRFTIHTKQAPYNTYVIGVEIPKGNFPKILLWDNEEPYHYIRIQPENAKYDLLIVGGEDHKTGQEQNTEIRFEKLFRWTKERFPKVRGIKYRWSGLVMEPVDYMAFIGLNPGDKRIYIVTGDSGHGMTHGTIAGILITDLIMGRKNPWAELYNPSRKTLKAAPEFLKENINVLQQYTAKITAGKDKKSKPLKDLQAGSGTVIDEKGKKIAVYKAKNGKICKYSAVCPHLGCIVNWNNTRKMWDCPCHGSRFDAKGKVVNGPANTDLERAE